MGDCPINPVAGWHWTFALVIFYSLGGLVLFLVRQWLLRRNSVWLDQPTGEGGIFRCRLRARFGISAAFLIGLSFIFLYLGADQDGQLLGKLFDDAGVLILTISFLEMHIYPWSAALLEIDGDLRPSSMNAYQTRLQKAWAATPEIQVLSLDHVRFKGESQPAQADRQPSSQTLDLYRFDLGEQKFEELLRFLELRARVHLPEL